ncbi:hypothetical protein AWC27_10965 [Mycobacterium szulgai]|uniref:DUF4189 domain-containing protein n=3 Tax=Mycobacterium szulgai TaxID=1787 RepID=A0A1X2DQG4_MYCSZ|nr:hypothetical protein AWC27_10965 [Mycobacterium szulgai]
MINKRGHRIALALASIGATAGLMILALPLIPQVGANIDNAVLSEMGMAAEMPLPHIMRYGAIAYAPSGAWGRSRGYESQSLADQAALENCADKDCKVIVRFNLCGAVAYDGSTYQGGSGYSRSMAEADALNRLPGGKIVNWMCQQH